MDRYLAEEISILPDDCGKDLENDEQAVFLEIHLDERFYVGEGLQLFFTTRHTSGVIGFDAAKKLFYDPDRCIDFISSYAWRKIFLTLTDKFSYLLPLIHDLPQIVSIYIYSQAPDQVDLEVGKFKLRAIVVENAANADEKLIADIELFKRDLLPLNVINPIIRETVLLTKDTPQKEGEHSMIQLQEEEEDNDLSVVWLQDENDQNLFPLKDRIRSLKMYVDIEACISYIQGLNNDVQVFIISSNLNNNIFLRRIINLPKIRFIYLLHTRENQSITSNESSSKIRGVYSSMTNLCDQLFKDYSCALKMSISIFRRDTNEKSVRDLRKNNTQFLWFQLLIDILLKIPHNYQAMEEMLDECEKLQKGDQSTAKAVEDLRQNYKSTEALRHYTAETFLYRRFNRALRTENIDFLFVFRFFLGDMYDQLRRLYIEQFLNNHPSSQLELYRGQLMTIDEFDTIQQNIGHLISINSFFSTTKNYLFASGFACYGDEGLQANLVSVVFQINVEDTGHSLRRPFASLEELSKIQDEGEVLFSVGTIFRIEEVTAIPGTTKDWYVVLTLVNDDDDNETTELRKDLEEKYYDNCDLCSLGSALIGMGDYNRAERYFQIILEYTSNNQQTMPLVYTYLGIIYNNKGEYQKALDYHYQALKYYTDRNELHHHENDIGVTYTHIGSNYHLLGNNQLALEYLYKATQIQILPRSTAFTFSQIAMIHRYNGNYKEALEYFQKALEIDENVLNLNKYNPSLATTYNNIGEMYEKLGDYENALKTLKYALDIRLKGTVSTHTDLAAVYNNLGCVYDRKKCFKDALEMYEKALEIDTQVLPENHPSLAVTHNNIAGIYSKQEDLTTALYHQEKSLLIMLKSNAKDDAAQLAAYQHNLGCIQSSLGNHTKALNMLEKALKTQMKCLPKHHENFSVTYVSLSRVYEKEGNISQALECLEKAVENARLSLLPHNQAKFRTFQEKLDLFKVLHSNDDKTNQRARFVQAELLDNTNVNDQLMAPSAEELRDIPYDSILERILLLSNSGTTYSRNSNYDMAIKCFDDAITLYNQRQSLTSVEEQELENLMTCVYFNLARLYYRQHNRTVALQILQKSLDLASRQDQQNAMLAEVYNFAGIMYSLERDFSRAEYYFNLAIDIAKKTLPNNHHDLQRYCLQLKQLKDHM